MRYRNLKTGAIFDSPCAISGGDWVAEETTIAIKVEAKHVEVKVKEKIEEIEDTSVEGLDGVTKKEIMQELEAMGIEYDPRARKEILYNLMLGK